MNSTVSQALPASASGLHWVQDELEQSLARVRNLFEQYMEAPDNRLPLQQALVELHQVQGASTMIQCLGVAVVAGEMKQTLQDFMQGRIKEVEAAGTALLGAAIQLSDYIDALAAGGEDCVLVFQPVINELRLVRGKGVLTEADLFAEQMSGLTFAIGIPSAETRKRGAAQEAARKFLGVFQQSLLAWLKEQDGPLALGRMGKIAEQLAGAVTAVPLYQLWRMISAMTEAPLTRGPAESLEQKRLLGRAGTQIKLLADQGEDAAAKAVADLPYQFLFYIGRSRSQGPKVSALRQVYQLQTYLPPPETVELLRQKISGPNTTLLSRLSEEIRKDLTEVKDNIDLVVRAGDKAPVDLRATVEKINRVADTLSMLGLSPLQRIIKHQGLILENVRGITRAANDPVWLEVATALLRVEYGLDDALFRQLRSTGAAAPYELEAQFPNSQDLRAGKDALLRELLVDLAQIKTPLDQFLKGGQATGLSEAAGRLDNIKAGLNVLPNERAATLVGQLARYLQSDAFVRLRANKPQAERFADAIACIEYYLESVQKHEPDTDRFVDKLAGYVEQLAIPAEVPVHDTGAFESPLTPAVAAVEAVEPAAEAAPAVAAQEDVEPEILEIFLEEAMEVRDQLERHLPPFRREPQKRETLMEIRRAFHTLKGSGRMVGAKEIGDFGWAVENLLNHCLDGTLAVTGPVLQVVVEAVAALPGLVKRFRNRQAPASGIHDYIQRVERLVAGEPAETASDLVKVFCQDARERLADVRKWLDRQDRSQRQFPVVAEVVRSMHTLRGSAAVVDAQAISQLAGAFEQYLDALKSGDLELPAEALALLDEATGALNGWVDQIVRGEKARQDVAPWLARLEKLQTQLPTAAVQAAADRSLADTFSHEAFNLLEEAEKAVRTWAQQPASSHHPQVLKGLFQTLHGAALMAHCRALGHVAHAFESRMTEFAAAGARPGPGFFAHMSRLIEGMYQQLDAFRDGTLSDDGAVLAAQVFRLEAGMAGEAIPPAVEETVAQEEVIEITPVETLEPASDTDVALDVAGDAEEIVEIPPVLDEVDEPLPEPPAPVLVAAIDKELAGIFRAEAAELLETVESSLAQWEAQPGTEAPLREIQRALHTLKGSARMAGLMTMGSSAHDMETSVGQIEAGQFRADAVVFTALRNQLEELQRMHDRLSRGEFEAMATEPAPAAVAPVPVSAEPKVETFELPPVPARAAAVAPGAWDPNLFWRPEGEAEDVAALRREMARVPVERLDNLLNQAGEISIYRSRLDQHNSALQFQLNEIVQTIARVRDQLRQLDIETDAQITARGVVHTTTGDRYAAEFDPLEMDRYSRMQELSRALSESINDLASLHASMAEESSEAETLLMQQGRIGTELQQGLMGTLMVPFSRQTQRLQRVVKQIAEETGKQAEVTFEGIEAELDRKVLERIVAPLEHLLRNAVVHGIETPEERKRRNKPPTGQIRINLKREGTQLAIELYDDGKGLDYEAIRRTAIERGLMKPEVPLRDDEVAMFIFEPGFSTARAVTQSAGRGIGMDVVAAEVQQLGGMLQLTSETGKGARLLVRLPLTLAISQALLVDVGQERYAIPAAAIESIARIRADQLVNYYREDGPLFSYGGGEYRVCYLGDFLGLRRPETYEVKTLPVILVRLAESLGGAERRIAVVVDALHGNREVVSKAVGPQVSSVAGIAGATILPDGRVVLILDLGALVQGRARRAAIAETGPIADERQRVMVVDDSVTIRRVTERLLDKAGYHVVTAKDGLDAIAQLQTESPATILLDIEMPRADGFEVATFVRNNERLKNVPIIMITSRSGEKHRERARQIGVNRYLSKPFQEEQLLAEIRDVLANR